MSGRNSVVECQLPKLDVVGSSPIARSILMKLAENESRGIGTKFEALVELSQERSTLKGIYDDVGFETR